LSLFPARQLQLRWSGAVPCLNYSWGSLPCLSRPCFFLARWAPVPSYLPRPQDFQWQHTLAPFVTDESVPFAEVLRVADVERILAKHQVRLGRRRWSLWTPAVTLWAFLWQVLSADQSCRQAVAHVVMAFALSRGAEDENVNTGNYCKARAQLPAALLEELALHVGNGLEQAAPERWRWLGRRVQLVDGSTSSLEDTEENQKAFPQPRTQKKGLGSPIIRWVVVIALVTATVQGLAYGPYLGKETGETALLRQLLPRLVGGDVLLADRFYCSYLLIALLLGRGVDVVARKHQCRRTDYDKAQRLGPDDYLVEWTKPTKRPDWLEPELYEQLPATLHLREVRVVVNQPGFRVRELVVVTTLLDARAYPAEEIAELDRQRWQVELDIRSLKITLGMDRLSCRTPFMVAKEIWAHVLAYNLVRKVAAQVASLGHSQPRAVSFKATKQVLLGAWPQLTGASGDDYTSLAKSLLRSLRKERVGHRPDRYEPRALKRRPKKQALLMEPRAQARAKLLGQPGPEPKSRSKGKSPPKVRG
jgi:putative transposase